MSGLHLHAFDASMQDDPVLAWIAEHHGRLPSPLYLYGASILAESVRTYRSLFPEGARGFYSLKSNPQPGLVQRFCELGVGAEVVSPGEWRVARGLRAAGRTPVGRTPGGRTPVGRTPVGRTPDVLVGGVSRSRAFLAEVVRSAPAALILDSLSEWRRLREVASADHPVRVLLRVNPGVAFGGLNMAGGTQFGLSPEQAIATAGQASGVPGVTLLGLHVYFGSQRLKNGPILKALDEIEKVMRAFREAAPLQVIDLGLGLGVPYLGRDPEPELESLRADLQERWRGEPWSGLEVWFEAGRALVARAGYFVSRVTEKKVLHDKTFVFLDGGISVHNPGIGVGRFFRDNPRFCFLSRSPEGAAETVDVVGNLCTSADQLGSGVSAPALEEGDLVIVPNAGAYCATTGMWGFNSQRMFGEAMLEDDGSLTVLEPQFHLPTKLPGGGAAAVASGSAR